MKASKVIYAAAVILTAACSSKASKPSYDKEAVILIDNTDSLPVYPDPIAISQVLKLDDELWSGTRIEVSIISDHLMNPVEVLHLPAENPLFGNADIRQAKVRRFKDRLAKMVDSMSNLKKGYGHSMLHQSIALHLNRLAESRASVRICFIYSDLMENGTYSFYKPEIHALLMHRPREVEDSLLSQYPLKKLDGIYIYCMYRPKDYEENQTVVPSFNFFGRLWESKGAHVELFLGIKD